MLANWSRIQSKDGIALRDFGDFLLHINCGMKSIHVSQVLNDSQENEKLCEKLQDWLRKIWARIVRRSTKEVDENIDSYTVLINLLHSYVKEQISCCCLFIRKAMLAELVFRNKSSIPEAFKHTLCGLAAPANFVR